jgi:heat shock protein HtpX
MPVTFIDIERQKSWRIGVLFFFLFFLYFLFAFIVVQTVVVFLPGSESFFIGAKLKYVAAISALALTISVVHFGISGYTAVDRVVEQVRAVAPDPDDGVHRQLINVMDEIYIASGGRKQIQCVVIPTLSLNALAVSDLEGRALIAITEGLLSRLTRDQIEAVMAHEVYHVLSNDCLEASVATSLFGLYAAAVEGLKETVAQDLRVMPFLILFWVLNSLAMIMTMFISREREYRADAGAVRMTRNPLALAEALNLISGRWTGAGFIHEGLEMLCISSPVSDIRDETEGWWSDLMSTHPPLVKRIDILLRMARVSPSALDRKRQLRTVYRTEAETLYYALDPDNVWIGPFRVTELTTFPWFSAATVLSTQPEGDVKAAETLTVADIVRDRNPGQGRGDAIMSCPSCRQSLRTESCAQTTVHRCVLCQGVLVDNDRIFRILARREITCGERIRTLLRAVTADGQRSLSIRKQRLRERKTAPFARCPRCGREMFRSFYSYAFLIELDKCSMCRITWFDADELDMLQCLIENKLMETEADHSDR